ncbi:MAG: hypothetical protein JSS27_09225 [Planctomycetes bacterium]|nr:hypothetical protein [Planctomycetota bacterium]
MLICQQWVHALMVGALLLSPLVTRAAEPVASAFKAGFAERDITPEIGMEQPGGYGKSFHRSLHDPCKVRAAVFDDGKNRVAIVGLDALLIRRPQVLAARRGIQERAGIAPEAVLISASHSHSSGPVGMVLPGEFDNAPADVRQLAYEKTSMANAEYLKRVEQAIVDAVCEANERRTAATAGVGYGVEERVAYNRRFRMTNGLTMTHPRQGNPDIVEPAGPVDPQVGVLGAWNAEGKLIGCVVNFACHATTSPGGISANYIYYLEQVIRGSFGPDVVVVFLPGCCGDITQVDNQSPYVNRAAENWARYVGGRVGAEAVKVLLTVEPADLSPVGVKTTVLSLKRRVPSAERVSRCRQIVTQDPKKVNATEWAFAKEIVLLDALLKHEPVKETEIQAVQVGPLVLITNPAEFFCEFGLRQKAESGFPFTFPVELANDCVGYVPTAEALGPRGGGYETRLTFYSNLEPTAGDQITEAGIKLAHQFKPTAAPERAKVPPFKGTGWDYGAVPPELD